MKNRKVLSLADRLLTFFLIKKIDRAIDCNRYMEKNNFLLKNLSKTLTRYRSENNFVGLTK